MTGKIISTYLLPIIIGLIMFNLGLSLSFRNFLLIFKRPKALMVGLFSQMIVLPIIAFTIAYLAPVSPEFKIGIILIAICPGGATSNLITYLLKGNVALSISLTSINSLLILITIPLTLYISIALFATEGSLISLPIISTLVNVLFMIILPVIGGMLFKYWQSTVAKIIENILKYLSIFLLALVFSFAIFLNKDGDKSLLSYFSEVAPYVVILNIAGMLTGYIAGKLYKFKKDVLITLPIEVGIQNSTLAITLAISTSFLNTPLISVPATVYGMFTFFSALLFGYMVKIFTKK